MDAIEKGYRIFYSGMAMGIDIIAFEILIELKKTYPDLYLISVMPTKKQCYYWPDSWIIRHGYIRKHCDSLKIINTDDLKLGCKRRNRYMVDNSQLVIAVFNGNYASGTGYTLSYAYRQNKILEIIDV